ncbi:MAG: glutamate racemase [Rhodoferax sp.]|nr:glutamate racemase [Rhodoferax sp.]MDP3650827.1 glutamate racemase [Rhodoferax sp.]
MKREASIGVFDSGVGGLSILRALRAELPHEHFVYLADNGHAPYGERGDGYVIARSRAIVQHLRSQHHIKALVVACNTATAAAIHLLRAEHPGFALIGVEPALKSSVSLSQTGHVGVIGTQGTLSSAKFLALRDSLAGQVRFTIQPCAGLAHAIETDNAMEKVALCARYIRAMGRFGHEPGDMDTLVLGCTHYTFASDAITAHLPPGVHLVETGQPVARQTRSVLAQAHLLRPDHASPPQVQLFSTGACELLHNAAWHWLGLSEPASPLHC